MVSINKIEICSCLSKSLQLFRLFSYRKLTNLSAGRALQRLGVPSWDRCDFDCFSSIFGDPDDIEILIEMQRIRWTFDLTLLTLNKEKIKQFLFYFFFLLDNTVYLIPNPIANLFSRDKIKKFRSLILHFSNNKTKKWFADKFKIPFKLNLNKFSHFFIQSFINKYKFVAYNCNVYNMNFINLNKIKLLLIFSSVNKHHFKQKLIIY